VDSLLTYLRAYFPLAEGETLAADVVRSGRQAIVDHLFDAATRAYEAKEQQLGDDKHYPRGRTLGDARDHRLRSGWTTSPRWRHFRENIGLEAYGQRDPLVEYKNQAFTMFGELTESIQADIVTRMFHLQFVREDQPPPSRTPTASRPGNGHRPNGQAAGQAEPVGAGGPGGKIGRNDPCWCGSGRKYKRCHGR